MLDNGRVSINDLDMVPGLSSEDWIQFYQLIGYSPVGLDQLPHVSGEVVLGQIDAPLPQQPVIIDKNNQAVFHGNGIVKHLFKFGCFDFQTLLDDPCVTQEDKGQLYQLLGYSLQEVADLHILTDAEMLAADKDAAALRKQQREEFENWRRHQSRKGYEWDPVEEEPIPEMV